MRITLALLALLALFEPGAPSQSSGNPPAAPNATLVFAAATIKPSNPDARGKGIRIKGRHFATINSTLSYLIQYAYGLQERQIIGGPAWIDKDKYDIAAVTDIEGDPTDDQWKIMLQNLLQGRFALTFRRGSRNLSAYVLVVAKNGPKLTKSTSDSNSVADLRISRGSICQLPAKNATMGDFSRLIQRNMVDRPVIDHTGLAGKYDFMLTFTPNDYQSTLLGGNRSRNGYQVGGLAGLTQPGVNSPPEFFTAIQEQLGLRLESSKARVAVLIINHVEKPTAN